MDFGDELCLDADDGGLAPSGGPLRARSMILGSGAPFEELEAFVDTVLWFLHVASDRRQLVVSQKKSIPYATFIKDAFWRVLEGTRQRVHVLKLETGTMNSTEHFLVDTHTSDERFIQDYRLSSGKYDYPPGVVTRRLAKTRSGALDLVVCDLFVRRPAAHGSRKGTSVLYGWSNGPLEDADDRDTADGAITCSTAADGRTPIRSHD